MGKATASSIQKYSGGFDCFSYLDHEKPGKSTTRFNQTLKIKIFWINYVRGFYLITSRLWQPSF